MECNSLALGSPSHNSDFCSKDRAFRQTFYLLCWEGVFAVAYDTWLGTTYISGLAGELNISLSLLSFMAAVPWLGGVSQLFGAIIFDRFQSAKHLTLISATIARTFWLIPITLAIFWGYQHVFHQLPFPTLKWFYIVASCSCISSIFGSISGMAWMAWMKDIVPNRFRGRFLGYRQRFTTVAIIFSNMLAASWIGWKPGGYRLGYALLGFMAVSFGGVSIFLGSKVRAQRSIRSSFENRSLHQSHRKQFIFQQFAEAFKNPEFTQLLLFGSLFNGSMQLASSYYPYYFTKELHIPMGIVALWVAISNIGAFISVAFWGRRIDRSRCPSEILWFTGLIVAIEPLFYVWAAPNYIKGIAPWDYLLNGMVWSGYTVAQSSLLFRVSSHKKSPSYFALYAAIVGVAGIIGTFLGGQIIQSFTSSGRFQALWIMTSLTRLLVLGTCGRMMLKSNFPSFSTLWRLISHDRRSA